MTEKDKERGPMQAAQQNMQRALPKRFYTAVETAPADGAYRVLLDGRPARTPRQAILALPNREFAEAIAAEWSAQVGVIDPARMPLTRLANTALDGVSGREEAVRADIVKYAGTDLLCYRADRPAGLVERQGALWDPVLAWAGGRLGTALVVATGLMHAAQPAEALAAFGRAVAELGGFKLTALHVMTTLTGSAVLALAVTENKLTAGEAWAAAHVDEDWQIAEWGEDAEAAERRRSRWLEMEAAARLASLASK